MFTTAFYMSRPWKGILVTQQDQISSTSRSDAGISARLRASLCGSVLALGVLLLAVVPASALAVGSSQFGAPLEASPLAVVHAPQIHGELSLERIFATRALLQASVQTYNVETKWHAEYSTELNGPWTAAGGGTLPSYENGGAGVTYKICYWRPGCDYWRQQRRVLGSSSSESIYTLLCAVCSGKRR